MKVRLSPEAESDLADIWYYIALDNPQAATRTIETVHARLKVLERFPDVGRERGEIHPGLRSWPIDHYIVFYTVGKDVAVHRILHGSRDAGRLFLTEP